MLDMNEQKKKRKCEFQSKIMARNKKPRKGRVCLLDKTSSNIAVMCNGGNNQEGLAVSDGTSERARERERKMHN